MSAHDLLHQSMDKLINKYQFQHGQIDLITLRSIVESQANVSGDGQWMACSQKEERQYMIDNYIKKTLLVTHKEDEEYEEAIDLVCRWMGGGENRRKERIIFMYMLAEHFGRHHHHE
ncbi:MAG: DUF2853 family protein [Bacteroidota bacterium]